jgi:hypothetical protein
MKTILYLSFILALLSTISCSKNDEEENLKRTVVGTWKTVENSSPVNYGTVEFRDDGTCVLSKLACTYTVNKLKPNEAAILIDNSFNIYREMFSFFYEDSQDEKYNVENLNKKINSVIDNIKNQKEDKTYITIKHNKELSVWEISFETSSIMIVSTYFLEDYSVFKEDQFKLLKEVK